MSVFRNQDESLTDVLVERPSKPRDVGLTHVLDDGVAFDRLADILSMSAQYIDIVKLGWGTALVTSNLQQKIELYHSYDIEVCFGGSLFEWAVMNEAVSEYRRFCDELGVSLVEISSGIVDMSQEDKCRYIETFAEEFRVLSEVGVKDTQQRLRSEEWAQYAEQEVAAGASYTIAEGRASGSAGLYESDGTVLESVVDAMVEAVGVESVLFESPQKDQQAWFIKRFGRDVNLANILLDSVLSTETLRLGLRGDTMKTIHGE